MFFYLYQELDAEASKVIYFDLLPDDPNEIPTLQIDYFGNYEIRNGTILWDYLDNQTNLYNAMPADYIGRAIKE